MDELPSLPALQVFAVAGRTLSFTRAAAELGVTQAAVSHQIKTLETELGIALFQRTTRRISLTLAGEALLPVTAKAFEAIGQAVAEIRRAQKLLAITTTPAFGAKWLAPRLRRFAEAHPDIELVVRHTETTLDLAAERLDAAIRGGQGKWLGLTAELIGPPITLAVAAPDYVDRLGLAKPADLARATLLHCECRDDWREWLASAGGDPGLARLGPVLDEENVLIEAALNGQGVAVAVWSLVEREVAKGRLVPVFKEPFTLGYGYYLVYPPGALAQPKVAAFRRFILSEARSAPFPGR